MENQLVLDWMTPDPVTVAPDTLLPEVHRLMHEHHIRRLPVMKDGELVGIVTLGDVREAEPSDATTLTIWEINFLLARLTVDEIFTPIPITVTPMDPLGHVAKTMLEYKVSGLPVLDNGKLVGIITESDIFRAVVKSWKKIRGGNAGMSKRKVTRKPRQAPPKSKTNWGLIAGVVGAILLLLLLFMTLFGNSGTAEAETLEAYCAENADNCISLGDPSAPITIVEVSDYGCPHCRNFNTQTAPEISKEYIESGEVQWVIMPYALSTGTLPPANAAFCASEDAEFVTFHENLFSLQESQTGFSSDNIINIGASAGITDDDFVQCVNNRRYTQQVNDNITAARKVGVDSTPTFFINGEIFKGAQPFSAFQQQIDSLLAEIGSNE